MNFEYIAYSQAGMKHVERGTENQDSIAVRDTSDFVVYSLADGCSPCGANARHAAEITTKFAGDFFSNPYVFNMKPKEIKKKFVDQLNLLYKRSKYDYEQMQCTCSVVAVNKRTGMFISLNIGDSFILAVSDDLQFKRLADPRNIPFVKNATMFCNTMHVEAFTTVEINSLSNTKLGGFVLCSDGSKYLTYEENIHRLEHLVAANIVDNYAATLLMANTMEDVRQTKTRDDVSIIIATNNDNDALRSRAQQICDLNEGFRNDDSSEGNDDSITVPFFQPNFEPSEPFHGDDVPAPLLDFLLIPHTAQEIVDAGYVDRKCYFISTLRPYLEDALIDFHNGKFFTVRR